MSRVLIIGWIIVILLIVYAFLPVRIPNRNPVFENLNTILVEHHEYTGSPDFEIVKGKYIVPPTLKTYLNDSIHEITVEGNSPLDCISYYDIYDYQFILNGQVVGVDSVTSGQFKYIPIFKIKSWGMLDYYPQIFAFENKAIGIAFVLGVPILVIILIVLSLRQLIKLKRK